MVDEALAQIIENLTTSLAENEIDRGQFYLEIYRLTGSEAALMQAHISMFSGYTGGTAAAANYLGTDGAKNILIDPDSPTGETYNSNLGATTYSDNDPSNGNEIYDISQAVALDFGTAVAEDLREVDGNNGALSLTQGVEFASATWESLGDPITPTLGILQPFFPGQGIAELMEGNLITALDTPGSFASYGGSHAAFMFGKSIDDFKQNNGDFIVDGNITYGQGFIPGTDVSFIVELELDQNGALPLGIDQNNVALFDGKVVAVYDSRYDFVDDPILFPDMFMEAIWPDTDPSTGIGYQTIRAWEPLKAFRRQLQEGDGNFTDPEAFFKDKYPAETLGFWGAMEQTFGDVVTDIRNVLYQFQRLVDFNGSSENEYLYGGGEEDFLFGGDQGDFIDGGEGDDVLRGRSGGDVFYYRPRTSSTDPTEGDGNDIIEDYDFAERDTIVFKKDSIAPEDVSVSRDLTNLVLTLEVPFINNTITLESYFDRIPEGTTSFIRVNFEGDAATTQGSSDTDTMIFMISPNGELLSTFDAVAYPSLVNGDVVAAPVDNTALFGTVAGENLVGKGGDDLVFGDGGNDHIHGGTGADTFVYRPGDGNDIIYDYSIRQTDTIKFAVLPPAANITDQDITTDRIGQDLQLTVGGSGGGATILLKDFFTFAASSQLPIKLDFETATDPVSMVFLINTNTGETVSKILTPNVLGSLGEEVSLSDVIDANDVSFFVGTNVPITIGTENVDIVFAGEAQSFLHGSYSDDQLFGEEGDDVFFGGGGNDLLDGGPGNDTVTYASSIQGISMNAFSHTVQDGLGGTDTLVGIENVIGSSHDDVLASPGGFEDDGQPISTDRVQTVDGGMGNDVYNDNFGVFDVQNNAIWNATGQVRTELSNVESVAAGSYLADVSQSGFLDYGARLNYSHLDNTGVFLEIGPTDINNDRATIGGIVTQEFDTFNYGGPHSSVVGSNQGDVAVIRYISFDDKRFVFYSGTGDDIVDVDGFSNSIIVQYRGGNDEIIDASGLDFVRVWEGITLADVASVTIHEITAINTIGDVTIDFGAHGSLILRDIGLNQGGNRALNTISFDSGGEITFDPNLPAGYEITGFTSADADLHGTWGDDTMTALDNGQTVFGLAGDDILTGGAGVDRLVGGDGDDTLRGVGGDDRLEGGLGNDTYLLGMDTGTHTVADTLGENTVKLIDGLTTNDVTFVRDGDNLVLDVQSGLIVENYFTEANTITHIDVNGTLFDFDTIVENALTTVSLGDDITVGSGETVNATTDFGDTFTITGGNNFITGGDGDDIFITSVQSNFIDGAFGLNTLDYSAMTDDMFIDMEFGEAENSFTFEIDTIASIQHLITGSGGDFILGGAADEIFETGLGEDFVVGGQGNDIIIAGAADFDTGIDEYQGDADIGLVDGFDTLDYSRFAIDSDMIIDVATGSVSSARFGDDNISGFEKYITGDGNDEIYGSDIDEVFVSGDGTDIVSAGGGNDTVIGTGTSDNSYDGGLGVDTISYEGSSVDILFNAGSASTLTTSDTLIGFENYVGGDGNDEYYMQNSDDNVLTGGAGDDRYGVFFDGSQDNIVDAGMGNSARIYNVNDINELLVTSSGNDLIISHAISGSSVRFTDWMLEYSVGGIEFADVTGALLGRAFHPIEITQALTNGGVLQYDTNVTATDDFVTTGVDKGLVISVLTNDFDLEGGSVYLLSVETPANGTAVALGDNVHYIPNPGFTGTDLVTYTVKDEVGAEDTATITITVNAAPPTPNTAPVAADDVFTGTEDTDILGNVLADNGNGADSDPDGDVLSVVAETVASTNGGSVVIVANGDFTYTPAADFNGADSFIYTVSDGNGGTAIGTVNVTVSAVADAPVANDDAVTTDEGAAVVIGVLTNDTDADNDTLSVVSVGAAANGTVTHDGTNVTYTPDTNFNGSDSFTYTVDDGNGGTDTATVNVTVNPVNNAPDAMDDAVGTQEDTAVISSVLANDTDIDGDTLIVTAVTNGTNGTVTHDGTNVTYTPNANFNGADSYTYTVSDGNGGIDTATVNVTVVSVNDFPLAVGDAVTTEEDTVVVVDVLANDSDADGDPLTITAVGTAANGTVTHDGAFVTYTPNANFNGADSFTYTISDGNGGFDTATVDVVINAVNDDPDAVADSVTTDEDTAVVLSVLGNDTDVENDTLSVTSVGLAANGTVTHDGTNVTYTPDTNFNGSDSFTYTISDGNGGVDTATVNVTVNPVNDAPLAADDVFSEVEDHGFVGNVLLDNGNGADSDIDGDALSVVAGTFATTSGGSVVVSVNGDFTYTPVANFNGTDTFTYTVEDGNGGTDVGTATVNVIPVNDDPDAVADSVTTDEDTAVVIDVRTNDADIDGDALSITTVGLATNGTVTHDGVNVTYTPNANFNGSDSFTYTVSDGNGGVDTATVNVTVNAVNDGPDAVDDSFTTDEDTPIVIDVRANDTDIDGDALSVTAVGVAANGTVTHDGTNVTYTPNANFNGADSFTYTISDGNGGADTATVNVTVNAVNDNPVAVDDSATTDEDVAAVIDVLANDSDVDGDTLLISAVTNGANGTVTHDGSTVTYTPNTGFFGTDSFSYTVSDGNGGTESATVNVTVNEVAGNVAPVAVDDVVSVNEDEVLNGNVLTNDTDADGDTLSAVPANITTSTGGTVVLNADGSFSYTPVANFHGPDTFDYTVNDGNGGSDIGTVIITVNSVNDLPAPQDDEFEMDYGTQLAGNVLADNGFGADSDTDGDALTVASLSVISQQGVTVTIAANGDFTYVAPPNFFGFDSFTYTVDDGNGGQETAVATIQVKLPAGSTTGSGIDDTLIGTGAADVFFGFEGSDFIDGKGGNDVLYGGSLNGTDTILGGAGNDVILGEGEGDNLSGEGGNDTIYGDGFGYETFVNGDDSIYGGAGDDEIYGGGGNDYIGGNGGADTLYGEDGDDLIQAGAGADTVHGGAGMDNLQGGGANDTLYGDAGDDTLYGQAGDDTIYGGDGNDTIFGGAGLDTIYGEAGDDVIEGNGGSDIIDAGEGHNTVYGGADDDNIIAGAGNDIIYGNGGLDTINAGDGNNSVYGGAGMDNITTGSGDDIIDGNGGADIMNAGDGNNTVTGGSDNDTITTGSGNDIILGNGGDDIINAGDGINTVTGGAGVDQITTGSGADTIEAKGGNDIVHAGAGADNIQGNGGDDFLDGGLGADTIFGGSGADIFDFNHMDAVDTISDFNLNHGDLNQGDVLDVSDLLTGFDPLSDTLSEWAQIADNGTDSFLSVDQDGAGTAFAMTQIAVLEGVTGLTDEDALVASGNLIV